MDELTEMKVRSERKADIVLISISEPYSGSLKANGSVKRGAYNYGRTGSAKKMIRQADTASDYATLSL